MNVPAISAVLIVKNEEKRIDACLKSLKWADEIIVIDNYSTDKTVRIAKRYTPKVFIRKGGVYDSVIDNKNFGFQQATKDWVLSIDADEIVTNECQQEILQKIKEHKYDAFYFNFKQFVFGKEFVGPLFTHPKVIRLFKKGKARYNHDYAHQTVHVDGTIGQIRNPIYHYSYPDIENFINKMNYYTTFEVTLMTAGKVGGLLTKPIEKVNIYYLFIEPLFFLPHQFIIKKNYKDGLYGLVWSVLMTFYLFTERAKLWLSQHKKRIEEKK